MLYAIPGISLASTTLAAMAALVIFGVTDLATVTAGFASKVLLLVVGVLAGYVIYVISLRRKNLMLFKEGVELNVDGEDLNIQDEPQPPQTQHP